MRRVTLIAGVLLCCVRVTAAWQYASSPRMKFDQYAVREAFHGKPASPKLVTRYERLYRTRIRDGARKGPNFAGHFTVAVWGCGTGCYQFVIVDEKTGTVYVPSFESVEWSPAAEKEILWGLQYRKNSRLLMFSGCPRGDEKRCGAYYYEWNGKELVPIKIIHGPIGTFGDNGAGSNE